MTDIIRRSDIKVELIDTMGEDIDIAYAAWVSSTTGDERAKNPGRVPGVLKFLMRDKHGSPFEMVEAKFRVEAPIFVFREWHRHRTQSYNEQSGRYTEFLPEFYSPPAERPMVNVGTSAAPKLVPGPREQLERSWEREKRSYQLAWDMYQEDLADGISKEMARRHLPVATYSTMYAKGNLRNWLKFLGLRTSEPNALFQGHPQWEIVQGAKAVELHLREAFPISLGLYDEFQRVAP